MILLLQDLVLGAGQDEMASRQQIRPESLDRGRRDHFVAAGRDQQNWLADVAGVAGAANRFIRRKAASAQATVGAPMPSSGAASSTAILRA